jgi:hypothetical protein
LRRSTMGAGVFHGRVRDGIGCVIPAMTTGPPGRILCVCCWRMGCIREVVWVCRWTAGDAVWAGGGSEVDRAIRTARLRALLRFHLRPIDVMVCHGPRGGLVLRGVSRLDAFSGYPVRT